MLKLDKKRLLQGTLLKCVDGRWKDNDGLEPPAQLFVLGTTRALQCWRERKLVGVEIETPDEPLSDHEALNAAIPESEWEPGLDGNPRPPWQLNFVVYLLDPSTAEVYTFINSTTGARIAYERLNDKLERMRWLRGENVTPVVALDSRPMKTDWGTKLRPEFTILEWTDLAPQIASEPGPKLIEHGAAGPVEPDKPDEPGTPESGASGAPAASAAKPAATAKPTPGKTPGKPVKKQVGKPVEPVSMAEEMKDKIPY